MQRNAFTMVELIFVIVIIGVLAATALPKFGGVRDNATANSEIAAMSSLDGAIAAAIEFRLQDYKDTNVSWHNTTMTGASVSARDGADIYKTINTEKKVLSSILDKGDKFRIIGIAGSSGTDMVAMTDNPSSASNDVLLITGTATDATNGLTASANDILGKPDKNDFWVFNPNSFDLKVCASQACGGTTVVSSEGTYVIVPAQSIKLVDINGTATRAAAFTVYKVNGDRVGTSAITQ